MNNHALAGLAMGGLVILVGLAWLVGALRLRRNRAEVADSYAASGGIVYTAVQLGCAGVLLLLGLGLLLGVAISR